METFLEATTLVRDLGQALEGNPPLAVSVEGGTVVVRIFADGAVGRAEMRLARKVEGIYRHRREDKAEGLARAEGGEAGRRRRPREPVERQLRRCRESLKAAIQRQGLTQEQVQERLGWGSMFISRMVRGHKRLDHGRLLELLEAIDLAPADFFAELYGFAVGGGMPVESGPAPPEGEP